MCTMQAVYCLADNNPTVIALTTVFQDHHCLTMVGIEPIALLGILIECTFLPLRQ